jgi:CubicO group peptidase (beta-lactamase class C family)
MTAPAESQKILEYDVPSAYRVPGGAAAIVKDGELIAKHCWGFANIDSREPVTSKIVFPICSISKQCVYTIVEINQYGIQC